MRTFAVRPIVAIVALVLATSAFVRAEFPTTQALPGVTYHREVRTDPAMRLFVAAVDLTNPKVRVRVAPGGADPDGPGEWETTLMKPTLIAAREGFDLVVNGDFFAARNIKDIEGVKSAYRSEIWAAAVGPAVTDGRAWSVAPKKTPCLVVHRDRRVTIEPVDKPGPDAQEVVAGNTMLVEDGKSVASDNKAKHPRTVVGLDRKGSRLTILVVDGRKAGVSIGMTYEDLAREMIRLECWRALNLDGGGSSVMAFRNPKDGKYQIVNDPSDTRERPVANVLGVTVDAKAARRVKG